MRISKRHLSLGVLLLLALVGVGCAVEAPYFGWPTPAPPAAPLWVRDVVQMLHAGIAEDAIIERVRENKIAARPTGGELNRLAKAGASDHLMVMIMAAALLEPAECPPMPTIEFQFHLWQPYPPLPGLQPIPGWHWLEGRGPALPRPERIEP